MTAAVNSADRGHVELIHQQVLLQEFTWLQVVDIITIITNEESDKGKER